MSSSSSSSGSGGGPLGCSIAGFNGGDLVWTTTRPAPGPISQFPGNPKGWQLDTLLAGSTDRIFVKTSYYVPQPGQSGVSPGGTNLDEIDSGGAYLGTRGMSDSGGGFGSQAWIFGARSYGLIASIPHAMGMSYDRLQNDALSLTWQKLSYFPYAAIGVVVGNDGGELFASFAGQATGPQSYPWTFPWGAEYGNFLVKWSSAGAHVFTKTMTATAYPVAGKSGDVFISGVREPGFDLGCGPVVGAGTSYVARLDASGQCLWSRAIDVDTSMVGSVGAVAPAADGSVLVVDGHFQGIADAGCGPLTSDPSGSTLIAKLDAGGACVWSKKFDALNVTPARFPSGDLLLSTKFTGTIDLGGGPLTSASAKDLAVAKLDASGGFLWSERFGAAGAALCTGPTPCAFVASTADSVILTGSLTGWVDFGGGPLGGMAAQSYAVKLDASGAFLWQHQLANRTLLTSDVCGAVYGAYDNGVDVTVIKLAP